MKKLLFIIISLLLFIPVQVKGATKEEIITYIDEKQDLICDKSTNQQFNTYRLLFTRMLKEKDLSSDDLDRILTNLKNAMLLIEENDICKKTDLDTLPSNIKTKIKDYLYNGMMIIYNAKAANQESSNSSNSIVIDKNNNTIDIYQEGNLYDKVELSTKTFNYVGPNSIIMMSFFVLILLFLISLLTLYITKKRTWKYGKLIRDFSCSLAIVSICLLSFVYLERERLSSFLDLTNLLKEPTSNTTPKEIIINENNEIVSYPAYGDAYATLHIESLNLHLPIQFGDSKDILINSIGHTTSSFLPGEGGTILMSGHNSSNLLGNLKNITKKTPIVIETNYGTFIYQVEDIKTMNLDQYDEIEINKKEETLVLYTCYPFGGVVYGNQRYVVTSKLIKEEWGVS